MGIHILKRACFSCIIPTYQIVGPIPSESAFSPPPVLERIFFSSPPEKAFRMAKMEIGLPNRKVLE